MLNPLRHWSVSRWQQLVLVICGVNSGHFCEVRLGGVRSRLATLAPALAGVTVLHNWAVIGRVTQVRVNLIIGLLRLLAPTLIDRMIGVGFVLRYAATTQQTLTQLSQPGRDLIDRRSRDHQDAEDGEQGE